MSVEETATQYIGLVRRLWHKEPKYLLVKSKKERLWHFPEGLNRGTNLLDILFGVYQDLGIECRLEFTVLPSEGSTDRLIIPTNHELYFLHHQEREVRSEIFTDYVWTGIPSFVAHKTQVENYPLLAQWILLMEKFMAYRYPENKHNQKS